MTTPARPTARAIEIAMTDRRLHRALTANTDDPAWRTQANCRSVDPEVFFPLKGSPDREYALDTCNGCTVRPQCLATALGSGDCEGVWGGTTRTDRRPMLIAARTLRTRTTT